MRRRQSSDRLRFCMISKKGNHHPFFPWEFRPNFTLFFRLSQLGHTEKTMAWQKNFLWSIKSNSFPTPFIYALFQIPPSNLSKIKRSTEFLLLLFLRFAFTNYPSYMALAIPWEAKIHWEQILGFPFLLRLNICSVKQNSLLMMINE